MSQIEEDDAMFELAKRLHCRRSPPALKVLCLDHIVNKWESWIALSENLQINIFYKICKHKILTSFICGAKLFY